MSNIVLIVCVISAVVAVRARHRFTGCNESFWRSAKLSHLIELIAAALIVGHLCGDAMRGGLVLGIMVVAEIVAERFVSLR